MQVEKYISEKDYPSALKECLGKGDYHLGLLLAKVVNDNSDLFCKLRAELGNKAGVVDKKFDIPTEIKTEVKKEITKKVKNSNRNNVDQNNYTPQQLGIVEEKIALRSLEHKETKGDKGVFRVLALTNWMATKQFREYLNKFSKDGNYRWGNVELVLDKPDYFVVINSPPIIYNPIPEKTIVFQMEPMMDKRKEMWGEWANPDPEKFFRVYKNGSSLNNTEYHLSKTYKELQTFKVEKYKKYDKVMSTVLSAKYKDPGHIKRIDFTKFLDKKGFEVHVYGSNKWEYKNYKKTLPSCCKDEAMFPYKYTFNAENNNISGYVTEKLYDGILAECLTFYCGAYDAKRYIDPRAFVQLDLYDFEKDLKTIQDAIEGNLWEERLPYIRREKKKILNHMQFFPRLDRILNGREEEEYEYSDRKD